MDARSDAMDAMSGCDAGSGRGFMTPTELCAALGGEWAVAPGSPCAPGRCCRTAAGTRLAGIGTDTRSDLEGRAFFALRGERFDAHDYLLDALRAGAALLVVERGRWGRVRVADPGSAAVLMVDDARRALVDAARAWRARLGSVDVIGVTGSAGKTTVKRLLHGTLSRTKRGTASPRSFNNDVGVPITLCAAHMDHDYVICEIGMNAPGEIAMLADIAQPTVAVVTMVGRAHLERLGSLDAIAREKMSLVSALPSGGLAVVRGDSAIVDDALARAMPSGVRVVRFGEGPANHVRLVGRRNDGTGQAISVDACGRRMEIRLALPGMHNAMNALAAVAVGIDRGIPEAEIAAGLASVEPADMRMVRQQVGGFTIFNDAYNANPDAVAAALGAFAELASQAPRRVVVLGDMLELGDGAAALHAETGRLVMRSFAGGPPELAIFVGKLSAHSAVAAREARAANVLHVPDLQPASMALVAEALELGDAILLKGSRGSAMERLVGALQQPAAQGRSAA
jgi:UDP-N-acetylmuramoyl-tripeptide--D-alanyl-D-alanine ligase